MSSGSAGVTTHRYGRRMADLRLGESFLHPFEVTVDEGMAALWAASFLDATPTWSSAVFARELGFPARPLPPLLSLNLALSFSVHDISEQAIAHLGFADVRFPHASWPGDTVRARSTVLEVRPTRTGDRGVARVRTALETERGLAVCAFEREILLRSGRLDGLPVVPRDAPVPPVPALDTIDRLPPDLQGGALAIPDRRATLPGAFEDFSPGRILLHTIGRTVGRSEHVQLATLTRNTHPLHADALYCAESSLSREPLVDGGLVLAWAAALSSRDLAGWALWDLGWEAGAHPAPVVAGDTLYAASKVTSVRDAGPRAGVVTLRLVAVKNTTTEAAFARHGEALFEPERGKAEHRLVSEKVFESTRALLVARREP